MIKRDQPYGRLAKNLLERQNYPDPNLRTYDDSGWTMGLAMLVDVKEIKDKAILDAPTTPVKSGDRQGKVTGSGIGRDGGRALRLEQHDRVPLQAAERADEDRRRASPPTASEFPAGSFVIAPPADLAAVRAAVEQFGLTAAALSRAADRGDARRRSAARGDLLVVERHAGDRLGPLHVRQVRRFRSI